MEDSPGVMGGIEPSGEGGNRRVKEHNWTIMLVSEHGRLVHVKHFVRYVIVAAVVLAVSMLVALGCFILFLNAKMGVGDLEQSLKEARKEIKALVDRNDFLLARLAVLGEADPTAGGEAAERETADAATVEYDGQEGVEAGGPESAQGLSAAVVVEGLRVVQASDGQATRIEFAVRKIGDTSDTVSGRVFVVLKGENDRGVRHMVVPDVPLKDGVPADTTRGQYFSIARYKAVTMMARIENPREFKTATVFVFSTDGGLLYKMVSPVKVVMETPSPEVRAKDLSGEGSWQ